MNRKGFEMAIGMIVTIVLGILIIGGGMLFLRTINDSSVKLNAELSQSQRAHLQELMRSGQLVAVYPNAQRIAGDGSGTFGLAIENRLNDDKQFTILVEPAGDPAVALGTGPTQWQIIYNDNVDVDKGKMQQIAMLVSPGKGVNPGTYTFFVTAKYDGSKIYESVKSFTVTVP